jgi:hypothetical protein
MNDETLAIGALAKRFRLNSSAIRYYERVGVLPEPAREGGRRRDGVSLDVCALFEIDDAEPRTGSPADR